MIRHRLVAMGALAVLAGVGPAAAQPLDPASRSAELAKNPQGSGGGPQKMLPAVERAKSDPAGLAAMLSPATQQRLRDLSVKLSDTKR